ncbi:MAG: hypothetical protein GY710_19505 [Desulfobacteraceae bacterium]|nr:hypothetical protein [Desulfobacteraceae bacterium]
MSKYFKQVVTALENDRYFREKYKINYSQRDPAPSIIVYAKWLEIKKKSIQEAKASETAAITTELLILHYIYEDKQFLIFLQKHDPGFFNRLSTYLQKDIHLFFSISKDLKKPLIDNHYRFYLDHMIQLLILIAKKEPLIKKVFKSDERLTLMADLKDAQLSIQEAKAKRLSYRRTFADKSKLQKEVLEFLEWNRFLGLINLKTSDLITRLQDKVKKYQDIINRVEPKIDRLRQSCIPNGTRLRQKFYEAYFKVHRLKATAQKYIEALTNIQQAEITAKKKDQIFSARAKQKFSRTNKEVTVLNTTVQKHLRPKDFSLAYEQRMERLQNELDDLIMVQSTKIGLRIDNLEDLIRTYESFKHIPEHLKPVIGKACKSGLENAYKEKQALLTRQQDLMEKLSLANLTYGGVMETISQEMGAHKIMLARQDWVTREYQNLRKLKKVATALNVYCSVYDFSFGLMLSIGNMVGADAKESVNKSLFGKGMEHLAKAVTIGGISPFTKAYDTGSFDLSLKLGLSFGPEFGGQISASMGLIVVYNAKIAIGDNRSFKATSTWTLKATGEIGISELFSAALELELYKDQTAFSFQDQYHWAAWFCQKFARLVAIVRACDRVCMDQRMSQFSKPTPSEMQELLSIADSTMQSEPQLKNILDEIAIYNNYGITIIKSRKVLGGVSVSGTLAGGFIAVGISAQRPSYTVLSKLKKGTNGKILKDHNGYEVMEQARFKSWSIKGSFTLPGINATLSFDKIAHLPSIGNGNNIFIQLKFVGLSDVGVSFKKDSKQTQSSTPEESSGSEESIPSTEPSTGSFGKWIERHLVPAAEKVDTTMPDWLSGFKGVFQKSKVSAFARKYNLAVIEFKLYQSEVNSEKKWILQYWWANGMVSNSIDIKVPTGQGVNIVTGAAFTLSRSFWEHPGANSLTYIHKVYRGFKGIPQQKAQKGKPNKTRRPDRASGKVLWNRFKQTHHKSLWKLGRNIGTEGTWVRKEVEGSGVDHNALVQFCQTNLQGDFNQNIFDNLMAKMEIILGEMSTKVGREVKSQWQEIHRLSTTEEKFNQASQDLVKRKDMLGFLNLAKTLRMRMKPFKKKNSFSKATSFTLDDCKSALTKAGNDMKKALRMLKSQAINFSMGKISSPIKRLNSKQLIERAIQACTHYKGLQKTSGWSISNIWSHHGKEGIERANLLRTLLIKIKNGQKKLEFKQAFIRKYINATLELNDINEILKFESSSFKDKNVYFDTVSAYTNTLNGGGRGQNSLRTIIKKQCLVPI